MTDSTGTLQTQYTYEPFGNTTVTGSAFNPYQYTGRESDGTGLYYYRARYYNPTTDRFISEDPVGFQAGINFYAYAADRPTDFRDPTGLLSPSEHYNITYGLAKQIFGPKCEARARAVAQADADQDNRSGVVANLKFLIGVGEHWSQGSIHFGGPVDQLLQSAFANCDDNTLGKALHGLQDDMSHVGAYADPSVHYWTSALSLVTLGIGGFNPADHPGPQLMEDISSDTASILRAYKSKCLKCCQ